MIEIRFNCNILWEKYIFSARCWLGKGKAEEWKVVSLWELERDNRQYKEKNAREERRDKEEGEARDKRGRKK